MTTATGFDRGYVRKVTLSSLTGNTLEYYDFLVYGTAAALIFPKYFFPAGESNFTATLASFATFAVGFFFRPIGGMFFGNLGDKIGRKSILITTMVIMGFSTFAIGLLPSYSKVGILAPILLVLLRCLQGFAVGGEWGGSMVIVLESVPQDRRGWFTCWPNTGGFTAQIMVTAVFAFIGFFGNVAESPYLWRIPFFLSIVIVAVGLWMRRSLEESPIFEEMRQEAEAAKAKADLASQGSTETTPRGRSPIAKVFLEDWRSILRIMGLRFGEAVPYFLLTVFALSYGTKHVGVSKQGLLTVILVISFIALPMHGLYGWLSDKYGRRPVFIWGSAVGAVMAFPFMMLLNTGNLFLIGLGYFLVLNIGHNALGAVQPAFFTELFTADRRFSGAAAGREIASIIAGGLTPFIALALAGPGGTRWQWVAGYVTVCCLITVVTTNFTPETYKRDLHASPAIKEPVGELI
ncbi:MAG: MHS family MFS transporter [Actinomycetota bacterium]|nr:MHS family MFS transporter [Actinomycetota bacterium]